MSQSIINDSTLTAIADAINAKAGTTGKMLPSTMPEKIAAIPTGEVEAELKDVNFYRPDGFRCYSYSLSEISEMTELPPPPEWDGHIFQEWNFPLEEIKERKEEMDIGGIFTTDDGCTRITICLSQSNKLDVKLYLGGSVSGGCELCWGDSNEFIPLVGTTKEWYSHTYATVGVYHIRIRVNSGTISFSGSGGNIFGSYGNSQAIKIDQMLCRRVSFGEGVSSISGNAFAGLSNLEYVSFPKSLVVYGGGAFQYCNARYLLLPRNMTQFSGPFNSNESPQIVSIGSGFKGNQAQGALAYFRRCVRLTIPDTYADVGNYQFAEEQSLTKFIAPKGFRLIGNYAFARSFNLKVIDLTRCLNADGTHRVVELTVLSSWRDSLPTDFIVVVPDDVYDDYRDATNWIDENNSSHLVRESIYKGL